MLVRYGYCCVGSCSFCGYYVCEMDDFKKLWKELKVEVDYCCVEIWDSDRGKWSLCDCWIYMKEWKDNGWYKNGWKFLKGI